ncbi:MAG: asparagine synthase (glutamine-hydrolyzing) [Flavobacteriales bacterium]|nr:asparagine synthase (glutamine-hydrolyzing) [Flavobacteriales bacterium]
MCGIAGIYHPKGVDQETVKLMTDAISHRGPDAEGFFVDGNFGLGHRRLSIIDLSTAANQPMQSSCGRYWMVFNGEVYNYREIAKDLDVRLKTTGDSEVILEAFAKWGPQMVTKLNGMFTIAIFDTTEKKLFLFRDRLGIKPLFVYQNDGVLAFASELKAIVALKNQLKLTVNQAAIPYFLHLGYIPQPLSIYNEVEKFPSGSWAVADGNSFRVEEYWNPETKITSNLITDEREAKQRLSKLLQDSVSRRLVSDVPFGTFLSGGIDSSLVTALAQKASSEKLKTFSIGFDDVKHDESGFARKVSEHLGTEHHEYRLTEKDALELITEIIPQYDEPYADSSAIPTMLVSKMARQEVTMTLSGDGGDELFHGYGMYNWAQRLANPAVKAYSWSLSKALSFGDDRYKRIAKVLDHSKSDQLHSHIFSQEQYMFSGSEIQNLLVDNSKTDFSILDMKVSLARNLSPAEFQALFDIEFYLKDDLLTKVDRASMKYSLETRVPILDHTVVEFALNLDPKLKVKDGVAKYLLKQVLYDHVPKELFDRPKWGFSIPLDKWLKNELSYLVDEYLNEKVVTEIDVVKWSEVRILLTKWNGGQNHLYNRIWLLILLHQWFTDIHLADRQV